MRTKSLEKMKDTLAEAEKRKSNVIEEWCPQQGNESVTYKLPIYNFNYIRHYVSPFWSCAETD